MEDKQVIESARAEIEKYRIHDKLAEHGKPLFLMVSGAHNFGFPSKDSDYDIRGVYQAPTKDLLGLKKVQPTTFEYMSEDKKLDVSIDEIGHYLRVLSNSNGNRLEWPSSNLIFYKSDEFKGLKELAGNTLSKKLLPHYLNFARDMWSGKTKEEGVKKDLYTIRVYMSGINIFENNDINPNINELNKKFGEEIINQMVKAKELGGEWANSEGYDREELENLVSRLDSRLLHAAENSDLPEKLDVKKIDDYLKELRSKNLFNEHTY